ncbi:hypothetical protein PENSPDRAFT_590740 [Peniophora sp. CONT]|nr:hypothetical protein PENSPDRAFT_590740 [Peniophora sp. CONT]
MSIPAQNSAYPLHDYRLHLPSARAAHEIYPSHNLWSYQPDHHSRGRSWHHQPTSTIPSPVFHAYLDGSSTFSSDAQVRVDLSAFHLAPRLRRRSLPWADCEVPATSPMLQHIRIVCDAVPQWPIDRPLARGITVGDILYAVHTSLQTPITHNEWARLSPRREAEVHRAYTRRCKAYAPTEHQVRHGGVRRVDYLGKKCQFRGLVWIAPENGIQRARLRLDTHRSL